MSVQLWDTLLCLYFAWFGFLARGNPRPFHLVSSLLLLRLSAMHPLSWVGEQVGRVGGRGARARGAERNVHLEGILGQAQAYREAALVRGRDGDGMGRDGGGRGGEGGGAL